MPNDNVEIDEFDRLLEEEPEIPPLPRRSPMSPHATRQLVVNSDVAKMLVTGSSVKEVAEELGISRAVVERYLRKGDLADLMEIEARRVIRHCRRRDLGKEKYLALITSLGTLVEKSRNMRDGDSTGQTINQTFIDNVNIALFGATHGGARQANNQPIETTARRLENGVSGDSETERQEEN